MSDIDTFIHNTCISINTNFYGIVELCYIKHVRLMSIVNLGLEGVGIMRQEGNAQLESALKPANSMKQVRESLSKTCMEEEWRTSVSTTLDVLNFQMSKLSLKGETFTPSIKLLHLTKR